MTLGGKHTGTYGAGGNTGTVTTFDLRYPEGSDIPTLHEDMQGMANDVKTAIENIPKFDPSADFMQYSMEIDTSLDGAVWAPFNGYVPPAPPANAYYNINLAGGIDSNIGEKVYWFSFGQWIHFFAVNGWRPGHAIGMSLTYRNAQGSNAAEKALVINAARRRNSFPTVPNTTTGVYSNAAFCVSAFNAHNSVTFSGNVGLTANLIYRFDRVKSRTDLAAMGVKAAAATPSDVLLQDPALLALENMPEIHGPA